MANPTANPTAATAAMANPIAHPTALVRTPNVVFDMARIHHIRRVSERVFDRSEVVLDGGLAIYFDGSGATHGIVVNAWEDWDFAGMTHALLRADARTFSEVEIKYKFDDEVVRYVTDPEIMAALEAKAAGDTQAISQMLTVGARRRFDFLEAHPDYDYDPANPPR
jgi:hypothetical protein